MTVQLNWPPDVVERLTEEAKAKGLSLDTYVLQSMLHQGLNDTHADEGEKRRAHEEPGHSIRELRKGNILGSDLTSATWPKKDAGSEFFRSRQFRNRCMVL